MTLRASRVEWALAAALGLAGSECSKSPLALPVVDRLVVIRGGSAADTARANWRHLVVQVRDERAVGVANAIVRFRVETVETQAGRSGAPINVIPVNHGRFSMSEADTTAADGIAEMFVVFSEVAGTARVIVDVPALALADTVIYETRAGRPIFFELLPSDTVIAVARQLPLVPKLIDAHGNLVTGQTAAFTVDGSAASINSSGVITSLRAGFARVAATAAGFSARASIGVFPTTRLIGFDTTRTLASMAIDGSDRRLIVRRPTSEVVSPHATRDERVVFHDGTPISNSRIWIVAAGEPARMVVATPTAAWPRWTADGQWIYYTVRSPAGAPRDRPHPS